MVEHFDIMLNDFYILKSGKYTNVSNKYYVFDQGNNRVFIIPCFSKISYAEIFIKINALPIDYKIIQINHSSFIKIHSEFKSENKILGWTVRTNSPKTPWRKRKLNH